MATNTTNYNLVKPALSDAPPDITKLNDNWDKIDQLLKNHSEAIRPIATGHYVGDGTLNRLIHVGFKPAAVLVLHHDGMTTNGSGNDASIYGGLAIPNKDCGAYRMYQSATSGREMELEESAVSIDADNNGFRVNYKLTDSTSIADIRTNEQYHIYMYIAIGYTS